MIRTGPLVALLALAISCAPAPSPEAQGSADHQPVVRSLSWPVSWLVERLAGDLVDHRCVLPAGEDAATWQPPGDLVAELARADLIVANGAGFEAWTATASLPASRLVDASRGIDLIERQARTHRHGPGGEHTHGAVDPHTFLDPGLLALEAVSVAAGLERVGADGATLDQRLAAVQADLRTLGAEWDLALAPLLTAPPVDADPDWAYLFARVGLRALPSSGSPPLGSEAIALIEHPSATGYDYMAQSRAAMEHISGDAHD